MDTPEDFRATATPLTLPPAPPPPDHSPVFFGRFGLRAGWAMAIFIVFTLIIISVGSFFGIAATGHLKEIAAAQAQAKAQHTSDHLNLEFAPIMSTVSDGITFLGMLAVCWFFAKAERRKLSYFGLGKHRIADLLPGAFWGLATLSLLIFVLHATHVLYFDRRLLFGWPIVAYALKWLVAFLFVGFAEEYMLRGYLQYTLTRGVFGWAEKLSPARPQLVAFWIAAVVMSLLFGAIHLGNHGENAFGISQVVLVGLVFSYALWRTGSLWWSVGFHMAWDWAQSFLYGVPDSGNLSFGRLFQTHIAGKPLLSGGVDGPEGSVYCVGILLLVVAIIRFTTKPGHQPPLEQDPPALPDSPLNSASTLRIA